jgi:hypothetical protein
MQRKAKIILPTLGLIGAFLALVISHWLRMHSELALATCVNNLRQLDGCKQTWALEHHAGSNAVPTWDELFDYVKTDRPRSKPFLECPSGGTYTIGRISESPICSIAKHTTSFRSDLEHSKSPLGKLPE